MHSHPVNEYKVSVSHVSSKKHYPSSKITGWMGRKQTVARLQRQGPVQAGRGTKSWPAVAKDWLKLPLVPSKVPSHSTRTGPSLP